MNRLGAVLAALLLAALPPAPATAACPPPEALQLGVRAASRIQIEQLGAEALRIETPFAHVPGRTLGYEVVGVFRTSRVVSDALQRAFGRNDSYACDPEAPRATFQTPGPLAVGLLFASQGRAVAVVLHLPEGQVELQLEGGERTTAPLSQAGQRRWEEALRLLSRETRASPEQFYEQMLPPPAVPPAPDAGAPAKDTTRAQRDDARAPR